MTRQFELVERIKDYDPALDESLVNRAYVFTMKVHGKQKRASGEPYFTHPIAVASILADMHMDAHTIVTGLLHDTVEDTLSTLNEIEEMFGTDVAKLVGGVTKLSELEEKSARNPKAENLRKLFVAMAEDIRVLIVKLADRLHNMRTLQYVSMEKRKRIGKETLEIYVPLAERMGMQQIKEELEDLAFSHLHPHAYKQLKERLVDLHHRTGNLIEKTVYELAQKLQQQGITCKVFGREKTPYSIWHKIQKKHLTFEQISDVVGFRIVVNNLEECYRVLGIIHHEYLVVPGKFKDYISTPKPNGYRSLHTSIIGPFNQRIEIQIRTVDMDKICEDGLAAHWGYKEGHKAKHAKEYAWLKKILSSFEEMANPEDFIEHAKLSMFSDEVFSFTPDGDLISLPQGATVLDFAYAIHSKLGEYASKAKVDGEIVDLKYTLQNGNQVEIITSKNITVSDIWLQYVTTSYARAKIKAFLKNQKIQQLETLGKRLLSKHLSKKGIAFEAVLDVYQKIGFTQIEHLYTSIAEGKIGLVEVSDLIVTEDNDAIPSVQNNVQNREESTRTKNEIDAKKQVIFAKCCLPILGDQIVGISAQSGKVLKIHRTTCKAIKSIEEVRQQHVEWLSISSPLQNYLGRLRISFYNNKGNLAELMSLIHQQNISLENIRVTKRHAEYWEIIVDINVGSFEQLMTLIAVIKTQTFVEKVERL